MKNRSHKEVVDRLERIIAESMMSQYNRGLKKRLTWQYLGIQTGTLRNQTNAISDGNQCIVGTIPWYGHAYETGNWARWKGKKDNIEKSWKRTRKATWSGKSRHRPFMADTIRDPMNGKRIARRVRTRMRSEGIAG